MFRSLVPGLYTSVCVKKAEEWRLGMKLVFFTKKIRKKPKNYIVTALALE